MGLEIKAGCGMKLFWRDRDVLLFIGGICDVLKFKAVNTIFVDR